MLSFDEDPNKEPDPDEWRDAEDEQFLEIELELAQLDEQTSEEEDEEEMPL